MAEHAELKVLPAQWALAGEWAVHERPAICKGESVSPFFSEALRRGLSRIPAAVGPAGRWTGAAPRSMQMYTLAPGPSNAA